MYFILYFYLSSIIDNLAVTGAKGAWITYEEEQSSVHTLYNSLTRYRQKDSSGTHEFMNMIGLCCVHEYLYNTEYMMFGTYSVHD